MDNFTFKIKEKHVELDSVFVVLAQGKDCAVINGVFVNEQDAVNWRDELMNNKESEYSFAKVQRWELS